MAKLVIKNFTKQKDFSEVLVAGLCPYGVFEDVEPSDTECRMDGPECPDCDICWAPYTHRITVEDDDA